MAFAKVAFCLLVIVAFATAASIPSTRDDAHNIVQCKPKGADDPILYRETESVTAWFWQVRESTFVYPTSGRGTNKITCVRVTDKRNDGHGGYPEILTGGVDFDYVTVRMVSQRGYGFKFLIEIYGVEDK